MKRLFFGGVHPADKKELSANVELIITNEPKQVTIPMSQHIGAPCEPLVAVGDTVKKGQKIGDGKYIGIHPVGGHEPGNTFFHAECFRAAHGQFISQIDGQVHQKVIIHLSKIVGIHP